MDGSFPPAQDELPSSAADLHPRHRSLSFSSPALQDQRPFHDVTSVRRFSISGSLSNSSSKGALAVPQNQQRRLSCEPVFSKTPLRCSIPKNTETINTWPLVKNRYKGSLHSECQERQCTPKRSAPVYCESLLSRQLVQNKHLMPHAESRRTDFGHGRAKEKPQIYNTRADFGHGYAREKPQVFNTCMQEPRSAITDFTAKLERLAAEQSRPKPSPSGTQLPWKSRHKILSRDEGGFPSDQRIQPEEDLCKLDSKLGNQFERLLSAIDGVTRQVQTAFEGLHERVDGLQASLEAEYDSGWKRLKDHFDQQGTPESAVRKRGARLLRAADSLNSLEEATETAREDIRILTGLLIVEKDADLMLARDFQDRQAMLLKLMEPYLKKPAFEQFWHIKHGLDHCVASVLFKTSNVLARTQSVMGSGSGSKLSAEDNDEGQFKRFCRKGQKGLEAIADWEEGKWSAQLKKKFLNACKGVWQLQSMVVRLMISHQVEFLRPEPGSKLNEATMDPLDCLSEDHFQPVVQFTIFPGFKIDDSVLIKSQVYLQPKCPVVKAT